MSNHAGHVVRRRCGAALLVATSALACSNSDAQDPPGVASSGAGVATPTAGSGGTGATGGTSSVAGSGGTSGASDAVGGSGGTSGVSGGSGAGAQHGGGGVGMGMGGAAGVSNVGGVSGATDSSAGGASGAAPTLFWLDVGGQVLRSDVQNFAVKTLVASAGQGPDGIAVDLDAGYIYWTNMGVPANDDGALRRSNLDGTGVKVLIPAGGTHTPKQLKLVPEQKKLYWSDREGMRVMRSNLDGSSIETLYTSAQGDTARQDLSNWCVGIAVDVAGGYFYWSQKGSDTGQEGSLRRAHLAMPAGENDVSRSDVEILFDGLAAPIDIDLDLDAGVIYWTDRGDNTVNRAPLALPGGATASTRTDREIIVPDVPQAIGIALDRARGLVYYTDAVGDVGRSNLDGSNARFLLTKSGAFTGIVVLDVKP